MKFWKLLSLIGAVLFALMFVLIGVLHDPANSQDGDVLGAPRQVPTIPIAR